MFKTIVFQIFGNARVALKKNKDMWLLPIFGGATFLLQGIMTLSFDVGWISDFNVWTTSFITSTFFVYAVWFGA